MLNEACNNNDVTHVENMVLNEVPNSNNAMRVANNVHLNTHHGCTTIFNGGYIAGIKQKSQLTRDER